MKKSATVVTKFPIGAWVTDPFQRRLSGGIEKCPVKGTVRFVPYAGEIVGTGRLANFEVYRVRFGDFSGYVAVDGAVCYQCSAADDGSHHERCPDKALRAIPHEPGYAA